MHLSRSLNFTIILSLSIGLAMPLSGLENKQIQSHTTSESALKITSINNFRDIGGYQTADGHTVKSGIIFRSGDLSQLSLEDQYQINRLGIKKIIDFRSQEERARAPSLWHIEEERPNILLLPIGGSAADWASDISQHLQAGGFTRQEIDATLIDMYRTVPIDNSAEYKALFEQILTGKNQPILFHCTSGKDRTGIGTALILSALGVPREIIMQDFLLSNTIIDVEKMSKSLAVSFSKRSDKPITADSIMPILAVNAAYLEAMFSIIDERYGSMDSYLREAMGLTEIKRDRLKKILLL